MGSLRLMISTCKYLLALKQRDTLSRGRSLYCEDFHVPLVTGTTVTDQPLCQDRTGSSSSALSTGFGTISWKFN
jgi:hypothetical protein